MDGEEKSPIHSMTHAFRYVPFAHEYETMDRIKAWMVRCQEFYIPHEVELRKHLELVRDTISFSVPLSGFYYRATEQGEPCVF